MLSRETIVDISMGRHDDPFAVLGPHHDGSRRVVRAISPNTRALNFVNTSGEIIGQLQRLENSDVFEGELPPRIRRYRLMAELGNGDKLCAEDPYRFPPTLGELELHLLGEGSDQRIYEKLGAHRTTIEGVDGTRFAVWAPNASRVSVVGDFNNWDGRCHVMRLLRDNGIWEIFVPAAATGMRYKFEIVDRKGRLLPLKSDPYGNAFESPPGNAAIIFESNHHWQDAAWMAHRDGAPQLDRPVSIYEVHAGSWRRNEHGGFLGWRQLADELVGYVQQMGYTHIELLPVNEHPFDGSWGYQPIGLFAPTHRFGTPDDFRYFVDCCHAADIGVIVDWVPAHFPKDEHGLGRFDGTALYEHEDPRKGEHAGWGTLVFNYGRREVINYLIGSALYWIRELHIDALRVDAVASMLYLDYSREAGEWLANEHGGRENLEAVAFLKRLNIELHAEGATSYAEESTAWPMVSRPVDAGGLGFTYKWNMGWMNDTLDYMKEDPLFRRYHHHKMTFSMVYAFSENFVLPLSHDEVVHGKGSLIGRMPGDEWQQFANLRAYLALMFAHPGKKLLFMGAELAQRNEWSHDRALDWHLLEHSLHAGMQRLVIDLNGIYKSTPALFERDFVADGFQWLEAEDGDYSVLAWRRIDHHGGDLICVANLTPMLHNSYRLGVPQQGDYVELLNTDSEFYGGSNQGNQLITAGNPGHNGHAASMQLTLPPLATIYLRRNLSA
jgi:1,4-alpha-glucan branching enzyme